ncbi:MAG: hypothetical protein QOG23_2207 [Blastocatellia bacterium]|jgi:hypothetical protein|nr:hypothetical protein [Blastocatellia bacterium]
MRNSDGARNTRWLIIVCVALLAIASAPLLSSARPPTTSVNIVNNSNKDIRNVYLSHVNAEDWSGNQLGDAIISAGQSFALSNVACDQQQVKVIGEDSDGCFLSTVVNCGDSSTWTITNDTARDCGGN